MKTARNIIEFGQEMGCMNIANLAEIEISERCGEIRIWLIICGINNFFWEFD